MNLNSVTKMWGGGTNLIPKLVGTLLSTVTEPNLVERQLKEGNKIINVQHNKAATNQISPKRTNVQQTVYFFVICFIENTG